MIRLGVASISAGILLLLLEVVPAGAQVTLGVAAIGGVSSYLPNANSGPNTDLRLLFNSSDSVISLYLIFDLSNIPSGWTGWMISKAFLYSTGATDHAIPLTVDVVLLGGPWDQTNGA